jgi:hypothetical protein
MKIIHVTDEHISPESTGFSVFRSIQAFRAIKSWISAASTITIVEAASWATQKDPM